MAAKEAEEAAAAETAKPAKKAAARKKARKDDATLALPLTFSRNESEPDPAE